MAIVNQRLFAKDDAALVCDKCGSSISLSGSARLGILVDGTCGYFWGKLLGEFLPDSWITLVSSVLVAALVVVLIAYWTAPIKSG